MSGGGGSEREDLWDRWAWEEGDNSRCFACCRTGDGTQGLDLEEQRKR